jgi:hypothetical protein
MTEKSVPFLSGLAVLVIAILYLPPTQVQAQDVYVPLDTENLQKLVAPVALYPDALLAQVLAACTYPDDVMAAAHWEDVGNNPQSIDAQPWDSSVKGVARYPSVLHYMASNADWINNLGDAFLNQQKDVMGAVQNLRADALAAGTLINTPQQTVINDNGSIQIIPTNPDVLYAPSYNPDLVYTPQPYDAGEAYAPEITFGPAVEVGPWLDFDLDWYDGGIYFGNWGNARPWWHNHGHYVDDRPGRFNGVGGIPPNLNGGHWTRDQNRPPPRPVNRPIAHAPITRPERGYPGPNGGAETNRAWGTDVSRESERGQSSRQAAGQPAPQINRPAPERAPTEAREAAPAPARSGAMGGYQSGEEAARSSSRGAESRGGGGGGGGAARGGGGGGGGAAHGGGGGGGGGRR